MADTQIQKIIENANSPKRAKGDEGEFEQHSLKDQIEADRYARTVSASQSRRRGFRMSKVIPGGTA